MCAIYFEDADVAAGTVRVYFVSAQAIKDLTGWGPIIVLGVRADPGSWDSR
jgi:hypothetical protein